MPNDAMNLDYETRSEVDLKKYGLDLYSSHPSTEVLMGAWSINQQRVEQWDALDGEPMPRILKEALRSPDVDKWAFNAQFERVITNRVLKIAVPYEQWRCSMCLAYMMGFTGNLAYVGKAMSVKQEAAKLADGQRLIRLFTMPQRVTKNQPYRWRDNLTDPEDYDRFKLYNRQDITAEQAIQIPLLKYPVQEREWRLYALDQKINDVGVFINEAHAQNALRMADDYKRRVIIDMGRVTGLSNAGSPAQILPWLKERGYPFDDVQADTVKKVLREASETALTEEAAEVLRMRQNSSKSSIAKYKKMLLIRGEDGVCRFNLQFHGASRTARWAGRGFQIHNLTRTPKLLEDPHMLGIANRMITNGDAEGLELLVGEQMVALVGCVRSAIIARPGRVLRVADLSSIESVVIGWFTDCFWFMDNLKNGRDLYRSFASHWLKIPYEDTKPHRSKAKPATLGAGYRLGGGQLRDGKKTGLWGYAENMGVFLSQKESQESVDAFRDLCPEVVDSWKALEQGAMKCVRTGQDVTVNKITFEMKKPFLCIRLPSGRRLYYYKPMITTETVEYEKGRKSKRTQLSYMGKQQNGSKWIRIVTHGGKLIENIVQAIARDILVYGLMRADKDGFVIPMHVHDEIVTEADKDDDYHTVERLIEHMTAPISWAPGLPLGAAGWEGTFYRKD
jgi:DNA polymerase